MGVVKAALIEFQIESATQNMRGYYAGYATTIHYFSREAVCSALSYEDSIWRDRKQQYEPLTFPFDSIPASPVSVKTADVIYKAGDQVNEGLLRFGRQEMLLPGSTFRTVLWGELPPLENGQVFLIGKKRAPAQIISLLIEEVIVDYESDGIMLPIQLPPQSVMLFGAFAPLVATQRLFILKIPLRPQIARFTIGDYVVPLVQE